MHFVGAMHASSPNPQLVLYVHPVVAPDRYVCHHDVGSHLICLRVTAPAALACSVATSWSELAIPSETCSTTSDEVRNISARVIEHNTPFSLTADPANRATRKEKCAVGRPPSERRAVHVRVGVSY